MNRNQPFRTLPTHHSMTAVRRLNTAIPWSRASMLLSLMVIGWIGILSGSGVAQAQDDPQGGPVYIVQEGDTLWSIALRFGVSMDDLARANGIDAESFIKAGDRLTIPGLEGIQGALVTEILPYGETLQSLSRYYQVPIALLARMNRITSPDELYAGSTLILPEDRLEDALNGRTVVAPGQSLLEQAILQRSDPWTLAATNGLSGTWDTLPGDVLRFKSDTEKGPGALPGQIASVELDPLPFVQGKTTVIRVTGSSGLSLSGSLVGHELRFFPPGKGQYVALQGVHAMTNPGLYPLMIQGTLKDGTPFAFSQMIMVQDGQYLFDVPLQVPQETLDPAVTKPEDAQWFALTSEASPEKMWDGIFKMPSPLPLDYCLETNECFSSHFGSRRSYNGSPYIYFHTGLDFYGGIGTEIFAPAPGVVVFAGFLTVRGNATVIDHGWGVYSAYMHQSEFRVKTGDRVETGQVIGLVGGTGRVQGPHLHWEIFAGGVQVEPLDWLERVFP